MILPLIIENSKREIQTQLEQSIATPCTKQHRRPPKKTQTKQSIPLISTKHEWQIVEERYQNRET